MLLIDELDKSDIDLPNDLLNVVEEGEFALPELERMADRPGHDEVRVLTDDGRRVPVRDGRVRCHAFPFVVMTSNGERDFPPRCCAAASICTWTRRATSGSPPWCRPTSAPGRTSGTSI